MILAEHVNNDSLIAEVCHVHWHLASSSVRFADRYLCRLRSVCRRFIIHSLEVTRRRVSDVHILERLLSVQTASLVNYRDALGWLWLVLDAKVGVRFGRASIFLPAFGIGCVEAGTTRVTVYWLIHGVALHVYHLLQMTNCILFITI